MWQELRADNLEGLAKYAEVVLNFFASDEYYAEASNLYLSRQLTNKGNNLKYFLYDDSKKQMVFGAKYGSGKINPFTNQEGMWKVIDLAYLGGWEEIDTEGVSQEALKFGLEAVRKWLADNNIKQWYVVFNMDTVKIATLPVNKVLQREIFLRFLFQVRRECWEIVKTEQLDDTHFIAYFNVDNIA